MADHAAPRAGESAPTCRFCGTTGDPCLTPAEALGGCPWLNADDRRQLIKPSIGAAQINPSPYMVQVGLDTMRTDNVRDSREQGRVKRIWLAMEEVRRDEARAWITPDRAPPSPAPSAAAAASLDVMAERLHPKLARAGLYIGRPFVLDGLAHALTGLPSGPERDAVMADILARLGARTENLAAPLARRSGKGDAS